MPEESDDKKEMGEKFDSLPDVAGDQSGVLTLDEVDASSLVSDDKDRPVADNNLPEPPPFQPTSEKPNETQAESDARRGKWSDEKKAKGRATRAARRANPQFADLPGGGANPVPVGPPPRDYYQEALGIFIPASYLAAGMLGQHWGIAIRQPIHDENGKVTTPGGIALAPDQHQYVSTMAEWLKFEQFSPMNARLAFVVASLAYIVPKAKTDPTPAKLKKAWEWVKAKVGFGKGKK